ncbi:sugar ABC transporter ATP-binding protein, partial [Neisseria gonorrhoeae SK8976]
MCRPFRPPDAGKAGKFPAAERAKRIKRAAGAVLCIETPPGTRYNPPFNISENLFLT